AMGLHTLQRRPAFPPVLTRDTRLDIACGTCSRAVGARGLHGLALEAPDPQGGEDGAPQSDPRTTQRVFGRRLRRPHYRPGVGTPSPGVSHLHGAPAALAHGAQRRGALPVYCHCLTNHHDLLRYTTEAHARLLWCHVAPVLAMALLPLATAWMAVSA